MWVIINESHCNAACSVMSTSESRSTQLTIPLHVSYIKDLGEVGLLFEADALQTYSQTEQRPHLPSNLALAAKCSLLGAYGVVCDGTQGCTG